MVLPFAIAASALIAVPACVAFDSEKSHTYILAHGIGHSTNADIAAAFATENEKETNTEFILSLQLRIQLLFIHDGA